MEKVPNFKLEPPEPKIVATCSKCGQDIYEFEDFAQCDTGYVCVDCAREEIEKELSAARYTGNYSIIFNWLGYTSCR